MRPRCPGVVPAVQWSVSGGFDAGAGVCRSVGAVGAAGGGLVSVTAALPRAGGPGAAGGTTGAADERSGAPDVPHDLPDAVLRPVRDGNAFESTVEHLATAIRLGVFRAGERLPPERELAERLKVGRATLRDAIGALRQAGLVTTSRGRSGGTVVVHPGLRSGPAPADTRTRTGAEVVDVLLFRRVVEPGAAALAAAAPLTAAQRAFLADALAAVTHAPDDASRRVADARLHLAVATLAGSPLLVEAVTATQSRLSELLSAIPVLRANIAHSDVQHADLVDAVLRGDAERARAVAEEHCDATSALLRGLVGRAGTVPASAAPAPAPAPPAATDPPTATDD
ncbi:MAG: FadR family transcriptional regulator [Actinobacteria bacterium]|nr:FadR family transcriptional regulator [Actinomycetota bacterium]